MSIEANPPPADLGAFTSATGRAVEEGGADKPRYRRYQYDLIIPHCGRSVLEVGAGLGEFAAQLTDRDRLVLTDVDPGAVEQLSARFPEAEVGLFDLTTQPVLGLPVETALAINVLEHFEDDAGVLAQLAKSVVPGGTIVVWVPAHEFLFSDFDRRVGHIRRYTPASLRRTAERAGLHGELVRSVNLLGGLAWWAAMRAGGAAKPNTGAVGLYDRLLVPATRVIDRVLPVHFGQSVLAVLRVPGGPR
ncbi:MAG TPA: class I SAM-dependent methyltransferase [Streptosporangiaceae bacterium]|jgi:SAM-dependent methyltransferase|nr:class I SAM-dependent methyltransferase [Streptosporangiaceae bacterium]